MEGIVWNRRYNIISIKNIIIKVYNIGNITAHRGISWYITVLRGAEGDIVGIRGCLLASRRIYGDLWGIQGDSKGIARCLLASRQIYEDIKVSPGITADL